MGLTKPRAIFIIVAIFTLVNLLVSVQLEIKYVSQKAKEVQQLMRTSADMSLDQTQLIDDFMAYEGREGYKIKIESKTGDGYVSVDLFEAMYGLNSTANANRDDIYNKLYVDSDFSEVMDKTNALRLPVRYYNSARILQWYEIPRVALLGVDVLKQGTKTTLVRKSQHDYLGQAESNALYSAYRLDTHIRKSAGIEYYNTPLNIGVTYLNKDLLGTLFINNVDLLMRYKYNSSYNLFTEEGGEGVYKGALYASAVQESASVRLSNPVNNASFTVLRGEERGTTPKGNIYKGVEPRVEYKVVDMYNSANDLLLKKIFGADMREENASGGVVGTYTSKAEYFKALDRNTINPLTGRQYETKPIVVAKVTFYLDVIIPYSSMFLRQIQADVGGGNGYNYVAIKDINDGQEDGVRRVEYTTYFAVAP